MEDNLQKHDFIVFAEDHYNPLGVVRSLGEIGIKPIVILVSENPCLINHCKYVAKIHKVKTQEEGYDTLLKYYSHSQYKPFVYTASDNITSLLDSNLNQLIDKFYFFHGKEQGIVTKYMNKDNINHLAQSHGCRIPITEEVKKGELPKSLSYPIMTKAIISTTGGWKKDVFICHSDDEIKSAYQHIASERLLLQEFIVKKNELCLDGFSFNNGNDVIIPYYSNYLRFTDKSYGNYMTIKPFSNDNVYNQVKSILKDVGFNGIFSVEYLIDQNDELYFLEVNFRNSTWSYAFTKGGYNMPYLWAKATLDKTIDLSRIKPLEEFKAMVDPIEFIDYVIKQKKISIWEYIREVKNCKCLFYYNKQDKGPFYHYWIDKVVSIVKKRISNK